jgi:hypothetical protein
VTDEVPRKKAKKVKVEEENPEEPNVAPTEEEGQINPSEKEEGPGQRIPKL